MFDQGEGMSVRLLVVLTAICGFAGCVSAPVYPSQSEIAQTYRPYAFKPISVLIQRIGAPTRSTLIGPTSTVYVWHGTATWRGRYPVMNVTHGTLSTGNAMDGPPLRYTESSVAYHTETSDLACDLEVYTDAAGTVQNVMVRGQAGACQQFMLR